MTPSTPSPPGGAAGMVTRSPMTGRATWVSDPRDPEDVIRTAVHLQVRELFVAVPAEPAPDLPVFRRLAELAGRRSIALSALATGPGWALDHAAARRWRDRVRASRLFRRMHLDVARDWPAPTHGPDATHVERCVTLLDQFGCQEVEVDLPAGWDAVKGLTHATVVDDVLARSVGVTVTTCRTSPEAILADCRPVLTRADALHTPVRPRHVRIAVSAGSFTSAAELEDTLRGVGALGVCHPSFRGVAVRDLAGWAALAPPLAPRRPFLEGPVDLLPESNPLHYPAPPDWNAIPVDWTAPRSATWR